VRSLQCTDESRRAAGARRKPPGWGGWRASDSRLLTRATRMTPARRRRELVRTVTQAEEDRDSEVAEED
jgi:hypothetical protein